MKNCLSIACLLGLLGGFAHAQDEDLEMELFFTPAETVTSATRHAQPLELSPSAITVLTRSAATGPDAMVSVHASERGMLEVNLRGKQTLGPASLRAFYVDPYSVKLNDPDSILEPNTQLRLPARWFLNSRVGYRITRDPVNLTAGVEAFNLLNMRFREHGGMGRPNGPDFGTNRLGRRVILFLRGEI